MKFSKLMVVTAVAAAAACAGPAIAQDAKAVKRAIEYRQGVLRVIGWDMGPMGAMAKGKIPFDGAEFARRAERLAAMAPRALEGFPEGTASVDGTPTRANEKIWSDRAGFEAKMDDFVKASAALAQISAGGDEAAMKGGLGDLGKTCKGCHDDYRNKEYK